MGRKVQLDADQMNKLIGQNIAMRRKAAGISQMALGEKLNVSFQQIQKYEKGTNRVSGGSLHTIARVLGCSVADLIPGADDGGKQSDEVIELIGFLATSEGLQLARAFKALPKNDLRRRVIGLIESISSDAA